MIGSIAGAYEHLARVASNPDELPAAAGVYRMAVEQAMAERLRTQHGAVYDDAGQKVAEGLLRAADMIDPEKEQYIG